MMATCVGGVPAASAVVPASSLLRCAGPRASRITSARAARSAASSSPLAADPSELARRWRLAPLSPTAPPLRVRRRQGRGGRRGQAQEQVLSGGRVQAARVRGPQPHLYRRILTTSSRLSWRTVPGQGGRARRPVLLESVVGGTQIGRFSFLGSRPYMEVCSRPPPRVSRRRVRAAHRYPSIALLPLARSAPHRPPLALPLHPPDRSSPRKVTSP